MSTETFIPEYFTVTIVLAALRGHCGVPVVLYHGEASHEMDERLTRETTLAVLKYVLQRGGIEEIRIAPARDNDRDPLLLDILDHYGGKFGVSPDDGDWPLGLSGCADFVAARKGRSTWRREYPSSWTDDDVYEFQHGLDVLSRCALDRYEDCAAVSAALLADQFEFARELLQRLQNEHDQEKR